jgi:hypothetical protein
MKQVSGADPGFQVRGGAAPEKLRRAEGGAKFVWVFRVKNHDFTPKNHIFSNRGPFLITTILSQSQKITKDEKYSNTSPQKYINSKK